MGVSIAQTHLTNMSKLAFVGTPYEKNIDCIYGDSNCVDLSSYKTKVKMVYVDGGHDLRTLESDTKNALEMLPIQKEELSCVIWHDYLNRNYNVTDYLDEMSKKLDLYHVEETYDCILFKKCIKPIESEISRLSTINFALYNEYFHIKLKLWIGVVYKLNSRIRCRSAIITGSSRGIGRAIAIALAEAGIDISLTYNQRVARAKSVADEIRSIGRNVMIAQLDISRRDSIKRMMNKTIDAFEHIDVSVNNAGILQQKPFLTISDEDWDTIVDTNLMGIFTRSQEALPLMQRQGYGRIINRSFFGWTTRGNSGRALFWKAKLG